MINHPITARSLIFAALLALVTGIVLLCSGCASVPQTSVRFNPATHELVITSPKEIEIKGLTITITDGMPCVRVESYASKNNVAVIEAIARQNAATAKAIAETAGAAIGQAAAQLK